MAAPPPTDGEAPQREPEAAPAAAAAAAAAGSSSSGVAETPLHPALRGPGQRHRPKSLSRVTWDEEAIAEHDKTRGTRQKIDEVDTPFPRSPQTNSDDELDMVQNISDRAEGKPGMSPPSNPLLPADAVAPAAANASSAAAAASAASPTADVCPVALADRLNRWVRSEEGSRQRRSSTSSASSADSSARRASMERRVSLEGLPSPRQGTLDFKAKRAQHYNEGAAMKAALQKAKEDTGSDEGPVSPKELADRLDKLVKRSGGSRSSASSASSDSGRRYSMERRVSLEELTSPRHGTSDFKSKRALHYNEGAAMKAALLRPPSDDEDEDSDSDSDDPEQEARKKKEEEEQEKQEETKEKSETAAAAAAVTEKLATPPGKKDCHATVTTDASPRPASSDFRQRRAQHYNEGAAIKAFRNRKVQEEDEDSEEDETAVDRHVSMDAAPQPKVASASFKAKRAQHYNEGAALRAALRSSFESSESSGSSSEEGGAGAKGKAKKTTTSNSHNVNNVNNVNDVNNANGTTSNNGHNRGGGNGSDSDSDTNTGKSKPNSGAGAEKKDE